MSDITGQEARLLEALDVLEMARAIIALRDELEWISAFADLRSKDDSNTFARVNRGALRTIASRSGAVIERILARVEANHG